VDADSSRNLEKQKQCVQPTEALVGEQIRILLCYVRGKQRGRSVTQLATRQLMFQHPSELGSKLESVLTDEPLQYPNPNDDT
jgi:hypothetical protein